VLFLGCSTGNGLEHVDAGVTARVDCIDINPGFIRSLVERAGAAPFALAARCEDVLQCALEPAAYDLIHAPLVFEYVPWQDLLPRLAGSLTPAGVLSVVLQRPSVSSPPVTPTRYTRLLALETIFRFVDPEALTAAAGTCGLHPDRRRIEPLPSGKAFDVFRFLRATE
jgi:SAM-dependent methyltransferase